MNPIARANGLLFALLLSIVAWIAIIEVLP